MLRPTKHSHPDQTVINLSLLMISHLKVQRMVEFCKLLAFAKKRVHGGGILFLPALNFLYILGVINYLPKIDSVEYIGPSK